jgi:hypothetical protein
MIRVLVKTVFGLKKMAKPTQDAHDYNLGDIILGSDNKTMYEIVPSYRKNSGKDIYSYRYKKFDPIKPAIAPKRDIYAAPNFTGKKFRKDCVYIGQDNKLYIITIVKGTTEMYRRVWTMQKYQPKQLPNRSRQTELGIDGKYYYDSMKQRGGYVWRKTNKISQDYFDGTVYKSLVHKKQKEQTVSK